MLLPSYLIIFPTARHLVLLLFIFWTLVSIVSAVPQLGILRDAADKFPRDSFMSYWGYIEFEDKSIPSDKDKMSDAQFINLAKVAYDEMVAIWQGLKFREDACPGAMMALESEGIIYFASLIRCPNEVEFNSIVVFTRYCIIYITWLYHVTRLSLTVTPTSNLDSLIDHLK